ncbi:hypothetical protein KEF85_02145 [Methylomonas paludis]|uniref:Uncharacterized protein n=1 Tax=Methylomonas paludis TaxID=1173101 RepID=A0A975RAK4_9GAMM|nr:hypothetical protein [Methylomonas paludis]QWF71316.1 hypothetical protein KEF85_02145 [Methylomonas paludis]
MPIIPTLVLIGGLLGLISSAHAAETTLTVPLDYQLIRNVLIKQLYNRPDTTARLWKDGKECSFLDLADPQISAENSQIKIDNKVHARIGLLLAGKCMPAIEWRGVLQTFQQPKLDVTGAVLSFPVSRITAYDPGGQPLNIGQLQDVINKAVQAQLSDLKIDLNQARNDIAKTLLPYISADDSETLHDTLNSLRFKHVQVGDNALQIKLGFVGFKKKKQPLQAAAFSADEMQQWQQLWQSWQHSLENGLNQPVLAEQSAQDKASLREVLQEAGDAFQEGLSNPDNSGPDPVREFFKDSWDKLAPLLRNASKQLPGTEGLQFITLVTATDVLYQFDTIAAPLGLEVSSTGLRNLVRAYLSHQLGLPKT